MKQPDLKRWRKQTRVNGVETHTLRLRHLPNDERGVILSLYLIQENCNNSLRLEIDGESHVQGEFTEDILFAYAIQLLQDSIEVIENNRLRK